MLEFRTLYTVDPIGLYMAPGWPLHETT